MKIYYVGSQSSGKTTLARYTSDKYKLPLLPESARLVLSELELQIDSLRADIDLVNKFQTQVFYRQIAEEKKYDNFCADRKSTRLNSSHQIISYAVFCLKKKKKKHR